MACESPLDFLFAVDDIVSMIAVEGGRAIAVEADVTDPVQAAVPVAVLNARCKRIDVLHNNVGITAMGGPVEQSMEAWHHVMDANLIAVLTTAK